MIKTAAPGPGIHHSLKLSLAIIITTFFASCLTKPTTNPDRWWYRPCDTAITKLRHGRSTTDVHTIVKNQLKIFNAQLKRSMKKINTLYNSNKDSSIAKSRANAKLPWLKMKKMLTEISLASKNRTETFYKHLQSFAGTLEVLRNLKIKTEILSFDQTERNSIFQNITYQMRSLLCEVQYYIRTSNDINYKIEGISLKKMNIPKTFRTKTLGLTDSHLIDVNFLKKMSNFINRASRILFKSKRKQSTIKGAVNVNRT